MTRPDDDDLLTTAGLPAWVRWAAAVGVAAALVAWLAVKIGSPSSTTPAAASSGTYTRPIDSVPLAGTRPVTLPTSDLPADDVVADGGTAWVLQGHLLLRRTAGYWHWQAVTVSGSPGAQTRLLLDRDRRRLWLVELGRPNTELQAFDARTLRRLGSVSWMRAVITAAPLNGSLYVADSSGLFRVQTNGDRTPIVLPTGDRVVDLAADPSRDRAVMLVDGNGAMQLSELGEIENVVDVPAPDRMVKGTLGVTASGEVWVAGFGRAGALLVRIDPRTLLPAAVSPLADQLGPGALLMATGSDALLVARGDNQAGLWCVDGNHGTPLQRWSLFAVRGGMTHGLAYAALPGGLVRLDLSGRCTG